MNKSKLGITIILSILTITLFLGCITDEPTNNIEYKKNTFYVDIKGSTNFSSIQEAIDAAPNNNTIFILSGHYIENLHINKSLTIIGENVHTTIIDGNETDDTIIIDNNSVIISNCTIINSSKDGNDAGIHINSEYVIIKNNIISNNNCGIYTNRASYNNIHNNTFKLNTGYGLYAYSSSNNMKVIDNSFFLNDCGLRVKGSQNCEIIRNIFNNNSKGMYFCCGARSNIVYHNTFSNHSTWNADDQVGSNEWNNMTEGNYWDDYDGVDNDKDGIGDEPYTVSPDRGIKDFFPLMNPL